MKKKNSFTFDEALYSKSAARRITPAELDTSKSFKEEKFMVKKIKGSVARQIAVRIGRAFNVAALSDPKAFYEDEKGWHVLMSGNVRVEGGATHGITFAFTADDGADTVEMKVMFGGGLGRKMPEILSVISERLGEVGLAEKYGDLKADTEMPDVPTVTFRIPHKEAEDDSFIGDIGGLMRAGVLSAVEIAA